MSEFLVYLEREKKKKKRERNLERKRSTFFLVVLTVYCEKHMEKRHQEYSLIMVHHLPKFFLNFEGGVRKKKKRRKERKKERKKKKKKYLHNSTLLLLDGAVEYIFLDHKY